MKKRAAKSRIKDKTAILVFFIASVVSLNILPEEAHFQLLGVSFMIATIYGLVCLGEKKKFIFKK